MKFTFNLLQRCYPIGKIIQSGTYQHYRAFSSSLVMFVRITHSGFFSNGNLYNRQFLLSNVEITSMTNVLKRNASKKAKNKKKASGSGSNAKVDFSISSGIIDLNVIQNDMKNVTKKLSDEFRQKYSARLTSGTLDNMYVNINGHGTPLFEVAQVKSGDKEFIITPMTGEKDEEKQLLQAIQSSGLNVNPRLDGSVIRIPISVASSEYKENIMKLAKASAEKSKVVIRKIRQRCSVDMRKHQDSTSKDTFRLIEKQIQILTDAHNQEIENILSKKISELDVGKK